MGKAKKGLADNGEGEFILNESGTSVSTDKPDAENPGNSSKDANDQTTGENDQQKTQENRQQGSIG